MNKALFEATSPQELKDMFTLDEGLLSSIKRALTGKLYQVAQAVLTTGLTVLSIDNVEEIAKKLGIELDAEELFHVAHTIEELAHGAVHLVASKNTIRKNI